MRIELVDLNSRHPTFLFFVLCPLLCIAKLWPLPTAPYTLVTILCILVRFHVAELGGAYAAAF